MHAHLLPEQQQVVAESLLAFMSLKMPMA